MVKSKMNRFTAMLLSVIMILSSFSILTTTQVSAASDPERVHVDMYKTGIKWVKTVTFYEPLSAKNWTYWQGQERHVLRVRETKQVAYCLQPGAYLYDWGISATPELSNKLNHAWDNLGKDKRNAIKLAMYFGYPNTNTTLSGTANEKELATQLIIWEFISGYRDTDSYNRTDARFIKALCGNNYDQNTGIYKAYGQIESAMKSFKTITSFANKKIESAPTHTLKCDGTKYTITLTDSNGVLSKYSFSCSNSDVKISKSGNNLTITSTNPINSAVSVKATKTVSTGSNSTIAYGHESNEIQNVIVKTDFPDPVYGYFKIKTEAAGSLKVVKHYKDLNSNNLTIYKESDDDLVERKFVVTTVNYDLYPESNPLYVTSEVTTGTDGKVRGIATVKDLPLAYYDHDTDSIVKIQYKIEEVDTPEYHEIPAAQTIIPMDGQKSVTIKNKLKTGTIKLIKKAEVNGSTEIIPLAGIEFSLRNSYNKTVLTDKDGKFLIENLLIGTYTIEELEIADRYIKTASQTVVVSANETASVTFENILKRGKVTTTKIDKDYPDNKLTGAIFEVYDPEGQLVDTLKEVSEGVYELDGLTVGNYTLKETKAPDGFDLGENAYPFEITENGDVRNIETLAGVGFINNPQKGDLVIRKRSSDKKLEGFSFRITGKAVTGQEYDQIFKTDAEGKITVKDLRVGTYTVSEIADETNVRYNLPDDQTVEIKSKEVTEVEMYNDEKVIPFELTKSDISTGELIPGCGFRIRNLDGEIVIEGYTDENGIAKFELVCGDYTYQEFDAPQGYIIDEKEYPFTINSDDTVVKAEMKNTGTGTIEITKTDISNGDLIPDCGIEILDENKKVIRQGRTDKNGVVRFDSLPYGKYYYREFDAPDGYVLDETPFEFEVKKNGEIIKATMTNKPVEIKPGYITTDTPKNPGTVTTPQTEDDSNTMAAVISHLSGICCWNTLYPQVTQKDEED